jgi:hypothetical protein
LDGIDKDLKSELARELDDLGVGKKRLERVRVLWKSFVRATVVFEVEGLRFEVARLDALAFSKLPKVAENIPHKPAPPPF